MSAGFHSTAPCTGRPATDCPQGLLVTVADQLVGLFWFGLVLFFKYDKNIVILKYHGTSLFSALKRVPQAEIAAASVSRPGLVLTVCSGVLGTKGAFAFGSSTSCVLQTSPVSTQENCRCLAHLGQPILQPHLPCPPSDSSALLPQRAQQSWHLGSIPLPLKCAPGSWWFLLFPVSRW